jgi:sterol desaturase/sphingolipid hydroxylase (fatty acid hydroxylase superfamily)
MNAVGTVAIATLVMFAFERLAPGLVLPRVRWWGMRLVAFNAVQVGVVFLAAATWDRWLPQFRLFDGAALGPVWGAVVGYVAITFVFYWWHRARHEVPALWRLHQLHHSPVRIEAAMSFYKHPLEILINGVMCSVLLYVVLGLTPATSAVVLAIAGVAEIAYHANLRTPRWLGWFFQRPEMHRRHHERGVHRHNYSDLPVWDLLFGTFDNPREAPKECGFANGRELQVGRLLLGKER